MSKRFEEAPAHLNKAMAEFGLGVDEETPEDEDEEEPAC